MRFILLGLSAIVFVACTAIPPIGTEGPATPTASGPGGTTGAPTSSPQPTATAAVTAGPTLAPTPQPTLAPTPEPTLAPTPQTPQGTRDNPYPVGQAITQGDWVVTVESVDLDAWDVIQAENQFNEPPAAGHQFVMFGVAATYQGTDTGTPWLDLSWAIVGSQGNTFEAGTENSCGVIPNSMLDLGELYPGASGEGNECLSVESAQVDGATIRLRVDFDFDNEVHFALTPTAGPVVEPPPGGGLTDGYLDLTVEQLEWLEDLGADAEAIVDAADPPRIRRMRVAVSDALVTGESIQDWLALNPPDDACYAVLHAAWTTWVDAYVDALDTIDYGLTPPITPDDIEQGVDDLLASNDLLDGVTAAMDLVTCI